jgi:hypothetical protein
MHRLSQRFCQQDLFEQMAWQSKWSLMMRSEPNLAACYLVLLFESDGENISDNQLKHLI